MDTKNKDPISALQILLFFDFNSSFSHTIKKYHLKVQKKSQEIHFPAILFIAKFNFKNRILP